MRLEIVRRGFLDDRVTIEIDDNGLISYKVERFGHDNFNLLIPLLEQQGIVSLITALENASPANPGVWLSNALETAGIATIDSLMNTIIYCNGDDCWLMLSQYFESQRLAQV